MPKLLRSVAGVREKYGLPHSFETVGAYVGVPVRFSDGSLYGVLCGFSFQPGDHLEERDLKRLDMAAKGIARLLAQADGLEPSNAA